MIAGLTQIVAIAENKLLSIGSGQVSSPEPLAFNSKLWARIWIRAIFRESFPNCADPNHLIALTAASRVFGEHMEESPR